MVSPLVSGVELGTDCAPGEPKLCVLQYAAGRIEACACAACPFWEEGGVVLEPGCALERLGLDLEHNPELVDWLLELRRELFEAKTPGREEKKHHLFQRLLPPDLRE